MAESALIERAAAKANRENATLNELFEGWLLSYVEAHSASVSYANMMGELQHVRSDRTFSRDEANQR